MRIHRFGNHDYAIGLNWRLIQRGEKQSAKIKELVSEYGSKFGAIIRDADGIAVGLAGSQKVKAPSAASALRLFILESSPGNGVGVIEEIPGDTSGNALYWLCAMNGSGVPIPGADVVGTANEIMELAGTYFGTGGFTVYSRTNLYPGAQEKSFAEMVQGLKVKPDIKALVTNPYLSLLLVVGIVGLGAGGFLLTDQMQVKNKNLKAMQQAAQRALLDKQNREQEMAKFEAQFRASMQAFETILSRPAPTAAVREWARVMDSMPLVIDGWTMKDVTCTAEGCTFNYLRRIGTMNDFVAKASAYGTVSVSPDGKAAIGVTINPLPPRAAAMDALPEGDAFYRNLVSTLQRFDASGMTFKGAPAQKSPPMKAPDESLRQIPYARGEFKIEGKYIFEFLEIAEILSVSNLSIESMTVDFASMPERMTWSMEGRYVVQ